jgi:cysteine-rich repeat protein
VCGDQIVDANEECDDGNTSNADSCRNDCTAPRCGDGRLDSGEQCDDGNADQTDSCRDCVLYVPGCGNGQLDPGEVCDDGNTNNNDACRNDCTPPACGDGIVDAGEACDDGNQTDTDVCRNNCTAARCGDGVVQTGVETCDDGNTVNTDTCRNDCTPPRCGDGIVDAGEQCDDGNSNDTDQCKNNCTRPATGPTCGQCRDANCRAILGVDMVAGCFEAINTDFGADAADPTFLQDCMDIVSCAQANDCAYDPTRETAECYCGKGRDNVQCQALGPVLPTDIDPATPGVPYTADKVAKCVTQWQRGTRSTINSEVLGLFGELSLPSGFADFLLKCDANKCNSPTTGDCTVPQ